MRSPELVLLAVRTFAAEAVVRGLGVVPLGVGVLLHLLDRRDAQGLEDADALGRLKEERPVGSDVLLEQADVVGRLVFIVALA